MAKVEYAFPVDKIHGRVSKKHKVGFLHRTASNRNFTTSYGTRSTQPSAEEIEHREKFAAVCKLARKRIINPSMSAADQAGFAAQKRYTTLWGYVFRQEWDAYEE